MNKDLSVMIDDVKLNIRVGAIIRYQGKILVEKNSSVDFGVIPGGRIKTLEDTKIALYREIKEELGIVLNTDDMKMVSFIENFFEFDNKKYHELYYVYEIELDDSYNIYDGMPNMDNAGSKYYLLDNNEFKKDKILPEILKEVIELSEFKNYIVNDLK